MTTLRNPLRLKYMALAVGAVIGLACGPALPDDIDIFTSGGGGATSQPPNVLIILDNTSNWARNDQGWIDPVTGSTPFPQGQSEVRAIKTAIGAVGSDINIGLMEFVTEGSNDDGGYIRQAVVPMTAANKATFSAKLDTIFNNINTPHEKLSSGQAYGDLMYDAYNYLGGFNTVSPSSTVYAANADANGYTTLYSKFKSPITPSTACAHTFIIFIANPNSQGPVNDDTGTDTSNISALGALPSGSAYATQLKMPAVQDNLLTKLGYTSQCYTSTSSCSTADYGSACNKTAGCYCDSNDTTTALSSCAGGTLRYNVLGTNTSTTTNTTTSGGTSACYGSQASCNSAGNFAGSGLTCPSNTDTGTGTNPRTVTTYTCSYACGSTSSSFCANSSSTTTTYAKTTLSACSATGAGSSNGINASTDANTPACPTNTDTGASSDPRTQVTYNCTAGATVGGKTNANPNPYVGAQCSGSGGNKHFTVSRDVLSTTVVTSYSTHTWPVTETIQKQVATTTTSVLGNTFACYSSAGVASTSDYSSKCSTFTGGCTIDSASGGTEGVCPSGQRYAVQAIASLPEVKAVSPAQYLDYTNSAFHFAGGTGIANADEWAKYLHQIGVPITGADNQKVSTYTIDVYYKAPNDTVSSLLMNMAGVSGGKYYAAHSESDIVTALKQILTEIQAVNSAFASASLPVNATNRARDKNQVFIGMFRPTKDATPRWYGNLKQYQLILNNGGQVDLGDVNGQPAVSSTTGFVTDCATSYWTVDTGTYWQFSGDHPTAANDPAKSGCLTSTTNAYSDSPDGPLVEKGAAAETVRNGNNPGATPTYKVNRTLWSLSSDTSSGPMVDFGTISLSEANLNNFVQGYDTEDENLNGDNTDTRPSIHGDVVHSRPQPVDYGGNTGVVVYYGANDGVFHSVRAGDGKELWGFVAPEFFSKLYRLKDNCPLINYPKKTSIPTCNDPSDTPQAPAEKGYFFDGSVGLYESLDTPPKVWIYPSMRRGGRMVYALDVSDPTTPVFKWKFGCPHMTDDVNCTSHGGDASSTPTVTNIGQTWSTPDIAFIKGYSTTTPVVILGGGNDPPTTDPATSAGQLGCEDQNTASPDCSKGKGHGVYILDAFSGTLLASFPTDRSVIADMALLDVDFDGKADYAYVADMGGNMYRIDFVTADSSHTALTKGQWKIHKVAHTSSGSRRFEFEPTLVQADSNTVYVALGSGDREHPLLCQYPFPTAYAGTSTCPDGTNFSGVTNRFYVFKDLLSNNTYLDTNLVNIDLDDCSGGTMANYTNGQTSANSCTSSSSSTTSDCTTTPILPSSSQKGWFIDLIQNGPGEQTVTSAVVSGGLVKFSTNRPIPPTGFSCKNDLGDARGYSLNLLTGSGNIGTTQTCGGIRSESFLGGGLPPSPVMATVPIDGVVKTIVIGAVQTDNGGIQSEIGAQEQKPNIASKRRAVYWYKSPGGDSE